MHSIRSVACQLYHCLILSEGVIRIDIDDPRPLEDQIAGRLRQAIAEGSVGPGEDLPSVRQLAGTSVCIGILSRGRIAGSPTRDC